MQVSMQSRQQSMLINNKGLLKKYAQNVAMNKVKLGKKKNNQKETVEEYLQ